MPLNLCFVRVMVSGDVVALYLDEEVVGRAYRRRGKDGSEKKAGKRPDETALEAEENENREGDDSGELNADGSVRIVGPSVVKNTINALVDLWTKQQSITSESIPNPRSNHRVKEIIKMQSMKEADRKRGHDVDRTEGSYHLSSLASGSVVLS